MTTDKILIVVGVVVLILGVIVHFLQGISLFPHASIVIGAVGVLIALAGAAMWWRARPAR